MESKNTKQLKEAFDSWRVYTSLNEQERGVEPTTPRQARYTSSTPEYTTADQEKFKKIQKIFQGKYQLLVPTPEDKPAKAKELTPLQRMRKNKKWPARGLEESSGTLTESLTGVFDKIYVQTADKLYAVDIDNLYDNIADAFEEISPENLPTTTWRERQLVPRIFSPKELLQNVQAAAIAGKFDLDSPANKALLDQMKRLDRAMDDIEDLFDDIANREMLPDPNEIRNPLKRIGQRIKNAYNSFRFRWTNTPLGIEIRNSMIAREMTNVRSYYKKPTSLGSHITQADVNAMPRGTPEERARKSRMQKNVTPERMAPKTQIHADKIKERLEKAINKSKEKLGKLVEKKDKLGGVDIVDPDFDKPGDVSGRGEKGRKKLEKINAKISVESAKINLFDDVLKDIKKHAAGGLPPGGKFKYILSRTFHHAKKAAFFIPGVGIIVAILTAGTTGAAALKLYIELSPYFSADGDAGDIALLLMCVLLEEIGIGDFVPEYVRKIEREAAKKVNNEEALSTLEQKIYDISQKNLKARTGSAETIDPSKSPEEYHDAINRLARQTMDAARMSGEKGDLFNVNESKLSKLKLKIILG